MKPNTTKLHEKSGLLSKKEATELGKKLYEMGYLGIIEDEHPKACSVWIIAKHELKASKTDSHLKSKRRPLKKKHGHK